MDHAQLDIPELLEFLRKLDAIEGVDKFFLLDEVRFSDLRKMNDANLQGRLNYYLRDFTFELDPRKRREFHREVLRTKIELRRRELERGKHAANAALHAEKQKQNFSEARLAAEEEFAKLTA